MQRKCIIQYEIKFKYQGVIGTYYMPLIAEQNLIKLEDNYSAHVTIAIYLGTN